MLLYINHYFYTYLTLQNGINVDDVSSSFATMATASGFSLDVTHKYRSILNGFSVTLRNEEILSLVNTWKCRLLKVVTTKGI